MRGWGKSGQGYTLPNGGKWLPKWAVSQRGARGQEQKWKKVRGRRRAERTAAEKRVDAPKMIFKNTFCVGTGERYSTFALLVQEFKRAMEV